MVFYILLSYSSFGKPVKAQSGLAISSSTYILEDILPGLNGPEYLYVSSYLSYFL